MTGDGTCPHSGRKCFKAPVCTLDAEEACVDRIQRRTSCAACKERYGTCDENFECFRETTFRKKR